MEIFNIKIGKSGQILHALTYIWNLKKESNSNAENRTVVARGGQMGEMGCWLRGTNFQLPRISKF